MSSAPGNLGSRMPICVYEIFAGLPDRDMKFCYEKKEACCCVPISNATCAYLFHLTIHGGVIAVYVFTTNSLPPLYLVDYFFGFMGISLSGVSFLAIFFIKARKCQCWRAFMGFLVFLAVAGNFGGTIWYTVERWDADMKTALLKSVKPHYSSGDPFWYFWLVCCWFVALLSIYYAVCILSCMCNPFNAHLFTSEYMNPFDEQRPNTAVEVHRYNERYRDYKPYPVQKS